MINLKIRREKICWILSFELIRLTLLEKQMKFTETKSRPDELERSYGVHNRHDTSPSRHSFNGKRNRHRYISFRILASRSRFNCETAFGAVFLNENVLFSFSWRRIKSNRKMFTLSLEEKNLLLWTHLFAITIWKYEEKSSTWKRKRKNVFRTFSQQNSPIVRAPEKFLRVYWIE